MESLEGAGQQAFEVSSLGPLSSCSLLPGSLSEEGCLLRSPAAMNTIKLCLSGGTENSSNMKKTWISSLSFLRY